MHGQALDDLGEAGLRELFNSTFGDTAEFEFGSASRGLTPQQRLDLLTRLANLQEAAA